VVGLSRAKRRLSQVVDWLKNPSQLSAFGMAPPRGFLLAGSPGTGKTLMARAMAGEAGLPFLALSAGQLQSKWVGEGEERIRELFQRASEYAPAIVFIDEIDGIARRRTDEGSPYSVSMLNQLLACMDGFGTGTRPVFVLAATNHPDSLDPALLRPGRFDEVIPLDLPNAEARLQFLAKRLEGMLADAVDLDGIVRGTVGCSPAELDRIAREAMYAAGAGGRARVPGEGLGRARRLGRFGASREDFAVRPEERRLTAWHEAGHALVHLRLLPDRRLDHLTIVPTESGALGYLAPLADETRHDLTRADLEAHIAVALAGREAEFLCTGRRETVTSGAQSDLRVATESAWNAVTRWGFDEEFGPLSLDGLPAAADPVFAQLAHARVDAWVRAGVARARKVLETDRAALERLADALLRKDALEWEGIREAAG
jgi:cell division protease FtsH